MHPSISHLMATIHVEDLRREADERRMAAQTDRGPRLAAGLWRRAAQWTAAKWQLLVEKAAVAELADPGCCAA
jgi:hypothetical protein